MSFALDNSWLIPLLPLIAAGVAGAFGKKFLRGQSHLPVWAGVGAAAIISFGILFAVLGKAHDAHGPVGVVQHWFHWFTAGTENGVGAISANFGAFIDPLSAVMLCVVCGIGFLICVFAAGYMKHEPGYYRFFAFVALFVFAMTCLVMGDNLVMLYLGWEGVGLCSYLLIGHYADKPAARDAAKKAFIVNRIGDFGFAVGIMLTWYCFGTVSYFGDGVGTMTGFIEIAANPVGHVPPGREYLLPWIPFALMLGAFGKSAQFPLHVWLPDAMEGPTPVSALIHAATMVTAGVYMIARLGTLFVVSDAAMLTVACVGLITAVLGGTIALRQFDLKRVFAYSTVSQLGFMFVALGVLAPVAAIFHLVTHAFFKALLFLSSGVVMHATGGELDMRRMSGLKKHLPLTRWLCLIGCAALAGVPVITAGYWSKDEIVVAASHSSTLMYVVLSATAFLTAYYSFRVYFRVFEGPEQIPASHGHGGHGAHGDRHGHHNHEPMVMIAPLAILAVGAIFAGVINLPFKLGVEPHMLGHFLGQSPSFSLAADVAAHKLSLDAHHIEQQFGQAAPEFHLLPLLFGGIIALLGVAAAYYFHLANRPASEKLAAAVPGVSTILQKRFWIDQLYDRLIVAPLRALGFIIGAIDSNLVNGVWETIAFVPRGIGAALSLVMQRGYLQGYALTMIVGVAFILVILFI